MGMTFTDATDRSLSREMLQLVWMTTNSLTSDKNENYRKDKIPGRRRKIEFKKFLLNLSKE
jgi:hypothetical protein